ncbi:MAG: putative TIM-barrel fold metal-dependent hydrolase [Verrucomicrobiales bacterium]|jgi:predicted TIM-barrel fold metal-dependent hydrolase
MLLPRSVRQWISFGVPVFFLGLIIALGARHGRSAKSQVVDTKQTATYLEIKSYLDRVRAIDTHDHLQPFANIPHRVKTPEGEGMTLYSLWAGSYYVWNHPLTPWPNSGLFIDWWAEAKDDFEDARAASFYRYVLPAFSDLYGVDFDTITDAQAEKLSGEIFANYQNDTWLHKVITEKANIELMFIDPYWARLQFAEDYPFAVPLLNVTTLMRGSHPSQFEMADNSPYRFAQKQGMKADTLEEFLMVIDAVFAEAKAAGAVCLKSTQAYERTLSYQRVPRERAEVVFGKPKGVITLSEQQEFEDFMFWEACRLSAKHDLPFQVHTGQARIQGSNPMLLVDVIAANPETKFILFHGGYPWIGETAVIAMRHPNVWIDSVWLPTLSYTTAKRAYHEWLEVMPSDRIMWGADTVQAEGIYGATEFTRRAIAEVLAEKVDRGDLQKDHALRIGKQILRDNALKLFPSLKARLRREALAP